MRPIDGVCAHESVSPSKPPYRLESKGLGKLSVAKSSPRESELCARNLHLDPPRYALMSRENGVSRGVVCVCAGEKFIKWMAFVRAGKGVKGSGLMFDAGISPLPLDWMANSTFRQRFSARAWLTRAYLFRISKLAAGAEKKEINANFNRKSTLVEDAFPVCTRNRMSNNRGADGGVWLWNCIDENGHDADHWKVKFRAKVRQKLCSLKFNN